MLNAAQMAFNRHSTNAHKPFDNPKVVCCEPFLSLKQRCEIQAKSPSARLTESLSADETQVLLKKVPAACNAQLLDVLLTACILAYAQYTPLKLFSISVLHHGLDRTLDGINLQRTVGNFYAPYPLFFDVDQVLDMKDPGKVLELVVEKRAQVPHGGATWLWICYYPTGKFAPWGQDKIPNAVFNYLGQTTLEMQNKSGMFRNLYKPTETTTGRLYSVEGMTPHTCAPMVEGDHFKIGWEYYPALDDQTTIERLAQKYLAVLRSFIKMTR